MLKFVHCLVVAFSLSVGSLAVAQDPPAKEPFRLRRECGPVQYSNARKAMVPEEGEATLSMIVLGIGVLVFCAIGCGIVAYLLFRDKLTQEMAFKLIALFFIICMGAFIIIAGYSQTQIAGLMGLLGVSLGFVFRDASQLSSRPPPGTTPPAGNTPTNT